MYTIATITLLRSWSSIEEEEEDEDDDDPRPKITKRMCGNNMKLKPLLFLIPSLHRLRLMTITEQNDHSMHIAVLLLSLFLCVTSFNLWNISFCSSFIIRDRKSCISDQFDLTRDLLPSKGEEYVRTRRRSWDNEIWSSPLITLAKATEFVLSLFFYVTPLSEMGRIFRPDEAEEEDIFVTWCAQRVGN